MKNINLFRLITVLIITILVFTVTGCSDQRDIMEEPEITVEYLTGEYADQLIRDGSETILGTVSVDKTDDGIYSLTVNSMLVVESEADDEGYYIADKNISGTYNIASDARVTYIGDSGNDPQVVTLDEFIELTDADTSDPLEEGNEELYDVYIIDNNALMIIAKELPEED